MATLDPNFEKRKIEHLDLALMDQSQAKGLSELDQVRLIHHSIPNLNLSEIQIGNPFFIAGMTSGHAAGVALNSRLAEVAAEKGWLFGVGSLRKQLVLDHQNNIDFNLTHNFPTLQLIANLGIAQVIEIAREAKLESIFNRLREMGASYLAIHLNPLQEAIQKEGTTNFKGSFEAIQQIIQTSPIPVVLKETGSGMSEPTLEQIKLLNPFAIDVSGLGGTHWGRIEGMRNESQRQLGETFENWGVSTVQSVKNAVQVLANSKVEIWASGGVRTGLDAAKLIALGATRVGFARPALEMALQGTAELKQWAFQIEQELRVAMFCTGSSKLNDLRTKVVS